MAISNAWLKANNNKPVDKPYMQADRDGLNVRVSKTGTLTFTMRYRFAGKADQMALGTYPEMSLAEAREQNIKYRAGLQEGFNPKQQKIEATKENQEALTFEQLWKLWFDKHIDGRYDKKKQNQRMYIFRNDVFPTLGKRLARDISLHEWLALIEKVQKRAPSMAKELLGFTKQIYQFGVIRELVPTNPVANLSAFRDLKIEKRERERYLEDWELRLVLKTLEDGTLSRRNHLFTFLCLFFGCRPAELRRAQKEHFDFEEMTWTVPRENHKTGKKTKKPIVRALIAEIVPYIKELMVYSPSDLLISKVVTRGENRDKQFGAELSESFYSRWNEYMLRDIKKNYGVELEHFGLYDLRKTMRTNMARIGEETRERIAPFHICEMLLGHKLPGDWSVYDKNQYLDQQREAYSAWWTRIHTIWEDAENVKVVNFR